MTNPLRSSASIGAADGLAPLDELEPLHTRTYDITVHRLDADHIVIRGVLQDLKPAGLYVVDDDQDMPIHHMVIELSVAISTYTIDRAQVHFEVYPSEGCPQIIADYSQLEGLSIARGFNRRIRELFGGPRGCAHTTALLQAMAPAAIQTAWSLAVSEARRAGRAVAERDGEATEGMIARNLNTCHIWDEQGQHVELVRSGRHERRAPLSVRRRLEDLGRDPDEWFTAR